MGAYLNCSAPLELSSCQTGPSRASWPVPGQGVPSSAPVASRTYAVGEIVERAYCLVLDHQQLNGSYVQPYLFPLNDGTGRRLFPWGWGLLYGRCPLKDGANLIAETQIERLPAKGDDSGSLRHWLHFRAARSIQQGEPLSVASPSKLLPVFAAAEKQFGNACLGVDDWGLPSHQGDKKDGDSDDAVDLLEETFFDRLTVSHLKDTPPETIALLEESAAPVVVFSSPIHGLGVFAARDISKGEVVEVAPSLPLEGGSQSPDAGILESYTFDHSPSIEMLQLGNAAIYNHSDAPNLSHIKYRATPFLEAWIADEDIEEGQELFHDYGKEYFQTRGMRIQDDRADQATPTCWGRMGSR